MSLLRKRWLCVVSSKSAFPKTLLEKGGDLTIKIWNTYNKYKEGMLTITYPARVSLNKPLRFYKLLVFWLIWHFAFQIESTASSIRWHHISSLLFVFWNSGACCQTSSLTFMSNFTLDNESPWRMSVTAWMVSMWWASINELHLTLQQIKNEHS